MTRPGGQPVVVVGAGWAGLACALELQHAGYAVTLLDAAPLPGGRARNATIQLAGRQVTVDNGQHLMIGAYRQSLSLLANLGQQDKLIRMPMQMRGAGLNLARRGPGRLGLALGFLAGAGLHWSDRAALVRFGIALAIRRWRWPADQTVTQLMQATGQTPHLVQRVWRPLCVGALNTEPAQACAQTFVHVLHDALLQAPDSADYLVSTVPLGELLAHPLWASLQQHGVNCRAGVRVLGLEPVADRAAGPGNVLPGLPGQWRVKTAGGDIMAANVVLATPWHVTARLLAPLSPGPAATLQALPAEAISTVYLAWPLAIAKQLPRVCLLDDSPGNDAFGQWFFQRAATDNARELAVGAVVVSASGALNRSSRQLAGSIAEQVREQLQLPTPLDAVCITEKRATFLCTPHRPLVDARSINGQRLPGGIYLAGDYCTARYPATLESAVISAADCARQIIGASGNQASQVPG